MEKHALAVKYFPHLHSPSQKYLHLSLFLQGHLPFLYSSLYTKISDIMCWLSCMYFKIHPPDHRAVQSETDKSVFFSCQKVNYLASNKFCQGKIELGNASCNFHHGVSARTLILVQVSHHSGFLLTVNLHKYINTSAVFPQLLMFMPQHFSDADL